MTPHGGDVWQVAHDQGIAAADLLDFSANINPRGLPPRALQRLASEAADPHLLRLYPDPTARRLRHTLADLLAVPPETIAVGPGAEALLAPVLRCLRVSRVLVPVPAFSEYCRLCAQQEIAYVPFPLDRSAAFRVPVAALCERIRAGDCDAVLLNNPHNPSGALLEAHELRRIFGVARSCGAAVLIDEAFIDYAARETMAGDAAVCAGLVVVRSLTKFYGCPALRVGYAIADPETTRRIVSWLPTWPVTQLASDALADAVTDREYAEASLCENAIRRERLGEALAGLGLFVFPSAANYLFLELTAAMPAASDLRAQLIARHRILIRNCDSYEGLAPGRYVRVAVRTAEENGMLIQALAEELRTR